MTDVPHPTLAGPDHVHKPLGYTPHPLDILVDEYLQYRDDSSSDANVLKLDMATAQRFVQLGDAAYDLDILFRGTGRVGAAQQFVTVRDGAAAGTTDGGLIVQRTSSSWEATFYDRSANEWAVANIDNGAGADPSQTGDVTINSYSPFHCGALQASALSGITSEATGGVLYYSGSSWVPLAAGTTGYVLTMGASLPQWSAGSASPEVVYLSVRKSGGGTISAGTPIYIVSWGTSWVNVEAADADDAAKMPAVGVAHQSITSSSTVTATIFGEIDGLNTNAWVEGTTLYVSTAGALTDTRPAATNAAIQAVARVTRQHASDGRIIVQGAGRSNALPQNTLASAIWVSDGSGTPVDTLASADTFTQYAILAGRSGGQTLKGGTGATENLVLQSTSHGTVGSIFVGNDGSGLQFGPTAAATVVDFSGFGNGTARDVTLHFNAGDGSAVLGQILMQGASGDMIFSVPSGGSYSFPGTGTTSVMLGANATATAEDATAAGDSADATAVSACAYGANSGASGIGAIAHGTGSSSTSTGSIAIGDDTQATGIKSVVVGGSGAKVTADYAAAFGGDAWSTHQDSYTFGVDVRSTATGQVVWGSATHPFTDMFFGEGVSSATPGTAVTWHATGGSVNTVNGSSLVLAAGTTVAGGAGIGGSLRFQTALTDTLVSQLEIDNAGNLSGASVAYGFTAGGGGSTTITTAGTPVKDASVISFVSGVNVDDSSGTNNRLRYTGATTRNFLVVASSTFYGSTITAAGPFKVLLYKNGGALTPDIYSQEQFTATTGEEHNFSVVAIVSLATNDYVELFVDAPSNNDQIYTTSAHIAMHALN